MTLANVIFGGTFTSRLNSNLREKNRFTYGAGSGVARRRAPAHLAASSSINAPKTLPALLEFCREFRAMAHGSVKDEEVEKARLTHRRLMIQALETQRGLVSFFAESAAVGLPPEKFRAFHGKVLQASGSDVDGAAVENFVWQKAMVVAVGDRQLIEGQYREWLGETGQSGTDGQRAEGAVPPPCHLARLEFRDRDGADLPGKSDP